MDSGQEYEGRIEETGVIAERPEGKPEILTRRWNKRSLIIFITVILLLIAIIPARMYIKRYTQSYYFLKFQETGMSYLKKGQYSEAEEEFKKAVRSGPDIFDTHFGLGLTYMRLNKLNLAAKELIEAIKINPKNIEVHNSLGMTFQRMGKFDYAMNEYLIVMKSYKEKQQFPPPELFDSIGIIYLNMKEYDKAIYAFHRATEIRGDYYPAYINLGKVYEDQGKKDLAIREYQKVKRLAAEDPQLKPFVQVAENRLASLRKK